MKGILIDENLPFPIDLPCTLPIHHARDIGVQLSDHQLWLHAQEHDLLIVTKDADFSARIKLGNAPPRIVYVKVGNMRRSQYSAWLNGRWPLIEEMARMHKLVEVYLEHMELIA